MDHLNHFSRVSTDLLGWFFPLTYLLHIAEEYFTDFSGHLLQNRGIHLSSTRFLVLQAIGLALMSLGIFLSKWLRFYEQMVVILAAVVMGNSLVHIVGAINFGGYEPGLITSLLVWPPLGGFALFRLWGHVKVRRYFMAVGIGLAICVAVDIITRTSR